ncbi:MAG TPA: glycosyltransferase [Bacteroidia bacterium]|nr:glycosyltransferase [Bacteroidia bacterium]
MRIMLLANADSVHTRKWATALEANGFEVIIFSLKAPHEQWLSQSKIKLIVNNKTKSSGLPLSKVSYISALSSLKKAIREFSPDIVHAHYATSYGLLGYLTRFKPFYISAWGSDVIDFPNKSFLHRWLLKKILNKADKIQSPSNYLKRKIADLTQKNVTVIPIGVDTAIYKPMPVERVFEGVTLGIIKSLEPVYRIHLAIEAFYILKNKYKAEKCYLLIVGGGSLENKLKQQVNDLDLNNYVKFTGRVPQNQVVSLHNAIDIFINVSEYESLGVSVLEAAACGKPAIATNVGGLCEVVKDEVTGYLLYPATAEMLAEKIWYLINHPERMKQMGEQGRKFVAENFELEKCIKLMIDEYLEK